jgi:hypothetical protein
LYFHVSRKPWRGFIQGTGNTGDPSSLSFFSLARSIRETTDRIASARSKASLAGSNFPATATAP